ncbi:proprotein convertase P-domain-containing protein [Portibacter marinus]|uniref:proprotein convertase P-domain-containing protein n=1 Tax=Portibacter marinus TaxID=2898660 RepID=UPI001F431046|nr:proprotein convertase P-domain-containing protein [Portibacter marinus]
MKISTLVIILCILNICKPIQSQDVVISDTYDPAVTLADFGFTNIDFTISGQSFSNLNSAFGLKKVCININHSFVGQLNVALISPSGTKIDLVSNRGGSQNNFENTCFDGISTEIIEFGNHPYSGTYQPEDPIALINDGGPFNGSWRIEVYDNSVLFQGSFVSYELTFGDSPPVIEPTTNDECAMSLPLEINNSYNCTLATSATLSQASDSGVSTSCSGFNFNDDIWFSFTAEDQEHVISTSEVNPSTDLIYEVFSGNCSSLTSIMCSSTSGFQVDNLIPGQSYYIRVASTSIEPQITVFNICISEGIPPPPANDDFCNAYELNSTNGFCYSGATFAGATHSSTFPDCQGFEFPDPSNDIWFKFVAQSQNVSFTISNMVGTSRFIYFQILSGPINCNNPPSHNLSRIDCYVDGNPGNTIGFSTDQLTVGNSYFIRLATSTMPQNTVFDICAASSNPPINDNCENPIDLFVGQCNDVNYTLTEATESPQEDPCPDLEFFNDDIWFRFTPSVPNIVIDAFNITGSDDDLMFEIFSGSCSNLQLILCYDAIPNGQITLTGLNTNISYLIRVASVLPNSQFIDFNMCIKEESDCPTEVRSFYDYSSYSLRHVVECSPSNTTVSFHSSLEGKILEFSTPTITLSNNKIFDATNFSAPLRFSNSSLNNTNYLFDVTGTTTLKNISIEGKSVNSMKIKVSANGILTFTQ